MAHRSRNPATKRFISIQCNDVIHDNNCVGDGGDGGGGGGDGGGGDDDAVAGDSVDDGVGDKGCGDVDGGGGDNANDCDGRTLTEHLFFHQLRLFQRTRSN